MNSILNYELEIYGLIMLTGIIGVIWILLATRKVTYSLAELAVARAIANVYNLDYLLRVTVESRHEYLLGCYQEYHDEVEAIPYIAYLDKVAQSGDLGVSFRKLNNFRSMK